MPLWFPASRRLRCFKRMPPIIRRGMPLAIIPRIVPAGSGYANDQRLSDRPPLLTRLTAT